MRGWDIGVATAAAVAAATACGTPSPYLLRLHVADAAVCETYEPALLAAIDWWADQGVAAFVADGCEPDAFASDVVVRQPPGYRPYTSDLADPDDHVAIYVVDRVRTDQGVHLEDRLGATTRSAVPDCPALVALRSPQPGLLAHELGHLVWLDHTGTPANVMHPDQLADDPATLQVDVAQVDEANTHFEACTTHRP